MWDGSNPGVGEYEGHAVQSKINELDVYGKVWFHITKRHGYVRNLGAYYKIQRQVSTDNCSIRTPEITSLQEIDELAAKIIQEHGAKYSMKTFHCKAFEDLLWARLNGLGGTIS